MTYIPENVLIFWSDRTLLLEVHSPKPKQYEKRSPLKITASHLSRKVNASLREKLPDLERMNF
ncbi:hypothetical protein H6F96_02475 [Microcoleus sp. FACHB-53]|nr:hypothetical protein [Microcoleus sp. FACHB-53]